MKYRKTPVRERATYTYRFNNGDKAIVSIGKMTLIIHDGRSFTYCDETITKEAIDMLHRLDDREVRELSKAANAESPQEKKKRLALKKRWELEHPDSDANPYQRPPKNIRIDAFLDSENWDEMDNLLYLQSDKKEGNSLSKQEEEIKKLVATFSKEEKFLYKVHYVKELSYRDISIKTGLSLNAIRCRMKRLKRKIQRYFNGSSDPKSEKSRTSLVKGENPKKGETGIGNQDAQGDVDQ